MTHLILIAGRPLAELSLMTMFSGTDLVPVLRCVKSLVRKVPTPKVGVKPASSEMALYSRHRSMLSESENTMHLDVVGRVARILAHALEQLGVGQRPAAVGGLEAGVVAVAVDGPHGLAEGAQELLGTKGVGQRDAELAAEAADPVAQGQLGGGLVVVVDGGDAHEPLVGDGADGGMPKRMARWTLLVPLALEALLLGLLAGLDEAAEDEGLGVVVAAAAGAELGKGTAGVEQAHALGEGLVLLAVVGPVGVHEAEVGLGGQGEQRDLVEDGVEPGALDLDVQLANVRVGFGAGVGADGVEGRDGLLARAQAEVLEEADVVIGQRSVSKKEMTPSGKGDELLKSMVGDLDGLIV
ncbi:diaminobutyrate decarboxylase [Colletotrichum higginsianum]|nr:diaminobutyrate decarboxylase [Colletotrichum higginsianum]